MKQFELPWQRGVPGGVIGFNEVHVWRVLLDTIEIQQENLSCFLSSDELARAGRFYFEKDQRRYISTRGMLRRILSAYLGQRPEQLTFDYNSYGKPALVEETDNNTLNFNLSHSDGIALYAVTCGRNIGIDIERIRDDLSFWQIARRFFSEGEISSLEKIPESQRRELFFQLWTRKEALLKASGEGISLPMEQLDVSAQCGGDWSPVQISTDNRQAQNWYGKDLFPRPGYAAAIVIEGGNCDLLCRDYFV